MKENFSLAFPVKRFIVEQSPFAEGLKRYVRRTEDSELRSELDKFAATRQSALIKVRGIPGMGVSSFLRRGYADLDAVVREHPIVPVYADCQEGSITMSAFAKVKLERSEDQNLFPVVFLDHPLSAAIDSDPIKKSVERLLDRGGMLVTTDQVNYPWATYFIRKYWERTKRDAIRLLGFDEQQVELMLAKEYPHLKGYARLIRRITGGIPQIIPFAAEAIEKKGLGDFYPYLVNQIRDRSSLLLNIPENQRHYFGLFGILRRFDFIELEEIANLPHLPAAFDLTEAAFRAGVYEWDRDERVEKTNPAARALLEPFSFFQSPERYSHYHVQAANYQFQAYAEYGYPNYLREALFHIMKYYLAKKKGLPGMLTTSPSRLDLRKTLKDIRDSDRDKQISLLAGQVLGRVLVTKVNRQLKNLIKEDEDLAGILNLSY